MFSSAIPVSVTDPTGSFTANYDPSTDSFTVLSSNGDSLFSDRRPLLSFSFLPPSVPATLILVDKSGALFLLNAAAPEEFEQKPLDVASFSSHFRVSQFSSAVIFGFVSGISICVYELVFPVRCLPIRRYRIPEGIRWFDFADAEVIVCVSGEEPDLRLKWFSLSKLQEIGSTQIRLENEGKFVDAAVSPADAGRVAVLVSDGHAELLCNRGGGERIGQTTEVKGAKEIGWSRFGTAVEIVDGDGGVRKFLEVLPERWLEGDEWEM
jgi:hypothetical protein